MDIYSTMILGFGCSEGVSVCGLKFLHLSNISIVSTHNSSLEPLTLSGCLQRIKVVEMLLGGGGGCQQEIFFFY